MPNPTSTVELAVVTTGIPAATAGLKNIAAAEADVERGLLRTAAAARQTETSVDRALVKLTGSSNAAARATLRSLGAGAVADRTAATSQFADLYGARIAGGLPAAPSSPLGLPAAFRPDHLRSSGAIGRAIGMVGPEILAGTDFGGTTGGMAASRLFGAAGMASVGATSAASLGLVTAAIVALIAAAKEGRTIVKDFNDSLAGSGESADRVRGFWGTVGEGWQISLGRLTGGTSDSLLGTGPAGRGASAADRAAASLRGRSGLSAAMLSELSGGPSLADKFNQFSQNWGAITTTEQLSAYKKGSALYYANLKEEDWWKSIEERKRQATMSGTEDQLANTYLALRKSGKFYQPGLTFEENVGAVAKDDAADKAYKAYRRARATEIAQGWFSDRQTAIGRWADAAGSPRFAGAAERGSVEAYSATISANSDSKQLATDQLNELKKHSASLETLVTALMAGDIKTLRMP